MQKRDLLRILASRLLEQLPRSRCNICGVAIDCLRLKPPADYNESAMQAKVAVYFLETGDHVVLCGLAG